MTDLARILPDFPTAKYDRLLEAVEKCGVTTTDLLTLDVAELGRRTKLGLLDVKRLTDAIIEALHVDLGVSEKAPDDGQGSSLKQTGDDLVRKWSTISTLDDSLDRALGGGIPTGYVTEITGESGAGKTQFLLTLLLSAQLPPPHGLGRPAMYLSTEAPLSTKRLSQILTIHPFFRDMDEYAKPSLDAVFSTVTPDLETQDHIINFQVPVEVSRRNIGLIVLDSVAANYRAEFERGGSARSGGSNMGVRSNELIRLGQHLHDLARKHNLAVVVANQVGDRFSNPSSSAARTASSAKRTTLPYPGVPPSQESPLASRSRGPSGPLPGAEPTSSMPPPPPPPPTEPTMRSSMPEPPPEDPVGPPALLLDHQQRWFTGWGDDPRAEYALKTPSLGLVWSTQLACRIALLRRPVYGRKQVVVEDEGPSSSGAAHLRNWRRWMKVVFAPHVAPSGQGLGGAVEFEVTMGGLRAVEKKKGKPG